MVFEPLVSAIGWPLATALAVSFSIEATSMPRPSVLWKRPVSALLIHLGLCLSVFAVLIVVTGRPWFTVAAMSAFLLLLMLINRAKLQSLGEPFVFQDFEYFSDTLRHPRLYLPFLGWGKGLAAGGAIALAIYTGWSLETSLYDQIIAQTALWVLGVVGVLGAGLMIVGSAQTPGATFDPAADIRHLGWLGSLWCYGRAERITPYVSRPPLKLARVPSSGRMPHIIAVQSESFFDPRTVFPWIRREVLEEFDILRAESFRCGPLDVPAWGANTVRTEFAFLTGLSETELGVHKFNPYRKLRMPIPSIASLLKEQGYRTICVHPYSAGFYGRDRIYPLLGFDDFIDIEAFSGAEHAGPFVSDAAVADMIESILGRPSDRPLFLFAITMENHGPLHLERVTPGEEKRYYTEPPPPRSEDCTVYLRHLSNASRMAGRLRRMAYESPDDTWIVWFGDHVPIMPTVYENFGEPDGNTEYLLWRKGRRCIRPAVQPLRVEDLGEVLLQEWGNASGSHDDQAEQESLPAEMFRGHV